jgi:outer membrane protein assembly factor BamB
MKILFTILLLSFHLTFAQARFIAVITDPQIGAQSNALNLIEVVEDINKQKNIAQIVVIGNITANGKFDEFIWAQEILDELTSPYFVIGGEKDYLLSEGKGSEISLLWSDDKNLFHKKNYTLISINTFIPDFPQKKYIDIETMNWLEDNLSNQQISRLLTFSFLPIQQAENSYKFFEMNLNKKIFSFVGKEVKSVKDQSIFEGLYLNRKEGWGYLLVSTDKDSIRIRKILSEEIKKKVKPEIVKTSFAKPLLVESNNSTEFISPGSKLWSANINKTKRTSSVYEADKIYSIFNDGSVICLNSIGKELWRFATNERIITYPLIADDLLVVASDDGDIITLNVNTGNPHQIIGIGERISSGISIIENDKAGSTTKAVVIGSEYGNLYCYDLLSLDPIWIQQLSGVGENVRIVSSIAHSNNKILFFDNAGTLYCLSATNGMLIWKIEASKGGWRAGSKTSDTQFGSNIIIYNKNLYLIDDGGNLFCVDALLGTPKWNIKNIYANGLIRLNTQQELILPTTKNKVIIISLKLGKVINEIELPVNTKDEIISDLLVIGDKIIVGFSDGWVYKLKPKQKPEKIFRSGSAPIISLTEVNGNCLVTDYDGNFTLLKISASKK